jgi:glucose/mannose-6-phosphate isomerase
MKEDIYNFHKQLLFNPETQNEEKWGAYQNYLLAGMGGSHLQGDILLSLFDNASLSIYSDYGLPIIKKETGVVVASYSGNTEEAIDNFNNAVSNELSVVAISKGGKLLELAKERSLPYIELPQNDTQPRMGAGYTISALLKVMGMKEEKERVERAADKLEKRKDLLLEQGKKMSFLIEGKVPIIYSSEKNSVVAKIWKINFNEGSKIPSFYNTIPELNHNEMNGFDINSFTKELSEKMMFFLLCDKKDHPRNQKRISVLKSVLEKRNFLVLKVEMEGEERVEKIFSSIILSGWIAYYLAEVYNNDPSVVPMVEEFKKMIA